MAKGKVTVKELLSRLDNIGKKVDKFNEKEEEGEAKEKFAQVPLADGETILEYDGELGEGTPIFVIGEDGEQMPAPVGTHELGGDLAGTSIVIEEEGIVAQVVTEEAAENEDKDEEMSTEETPDINSIVEAKVNEALQPILEKIENGFKQVESTQNELKEDFAKLKEEPSEKKEEKQKFKRDNELTPKQRIILARRNKK